MRRNGMTEDAPGASISTQAVDETPKRRRGKGGGDVASAMRRNAPTPPTPLRKEDWYPLVQSYLRYLAAANRTPKTILNYRQGLQDFAVHCRAKDIRLNVAEITRAHVETYMSDHFRVRQLAANTAKLHLQSIKQFFRWLVDEGEIDRSPCARILNPAVPEEAPPVFTKTELRRLFDTCEKGKDFRSKRDYAVLRLLLSCGMRRAELASIRLDHVDWQECTVTVYGKARRDRILPFGKKASQALDRYIRARARHVHSDDPALWIGHQGALTHDGLYQVVRRRAHQAGLGNKYPHLFRHTAAHMWLKREGSEGGLMKRMGWQARGMLGRYGASLAEERAREEYRRRTPDDDI